MLKFYNFDIVFQEIPDETTLAVNLTNCPNHCKGCHSPHLWADTGTPLEEESLKTLLIPYINGITCFCFMGGDAEPEAVNHLAGLLRNLYPKLKIGWYSGRNEIVPEIKFSNFDYIKVGPYQEEERSLKSSTTNQHLYKILSSGEKLDITSKFWRH